MSELLPVLHTYQWNVLEIITKYSVTWKLSNDVAAFLIEWALNSFNYRLNNDWWISIRNAGM